MANPFTPNPDDGAIDILRTIFGKVMDNIVAGGSAATAGNDAANMLGEAFRYFNSGVLFFASIILMWVTVFSVVNTANDGEALGKRWSTFYTPLRTFASAALLMPTASGYAAIQLIFLVIVSWSIGFASNMWSAVVQYSGGADVVNEAVRSITDDAGFEALATNALKMQVCAQAVNNAVNAVVYESKTKLTLYAANATSVDGDSDVRETKFMMMDPAWRGSENICGQIIVSNTFATVSADKMAGGSKATQQIVGGLQKAIGDIRYKYVTSLFYGPTAAIANEIARKIDTPTEVIDSAEIAAAITQQRVQMMAAITTEVKKQVENSNAGVIKKLSEKGWIYAGSLYMEIARIKDAIRLATSSQSSFISGTNSLEHKLSGDVLKSVDGSLAKYNVIMAELTQKVMTTQSKLTPKTSPPKIQTNFTVSDFSSGGGSVIASITRWFNQDIGTWVITKVVGIMGSTEDVHPVMKVKDIGDAFAGTAETILVTKKLLNVVLKPLQKAAEVGSNSWVPGSTVAGAVISGAITVLLETVAELMSMYGPGIYTMLYAGYFLGIWLPMIPFYIFAVGVVGWLVFVIEMLAAGVLWTAAHTTPAREDSFIGSQTQGYMLVMSGFFRPALMVLGLVASNVVLAPVVQYINAAFLVAFQSNQANSTTGLLSVAGYLLVYCSIITAVFMLVFSLPQTLPDRILRWIGAGIGDMGEQGTASKVEQSASTQARMAATHGTTASAAASNERSHRERQSAEKDQKASTEKEHAPEGIGGQSTVPPPKPDAGNLN